MPERPAASPPLVEARPVRQPPGHLGRAYASAFVETGVLEVALPQTEQLPATAVTTAATSAASVAATAAAVPAPRAAATSESSTAVVPQAPCACTGQERDRGRREGPHGRRAGDLLTGVAIGVVLGLLAVVLAGLTAAQLGVLPR